MFSFFTSVVLAALCFGDTPAPARDATPATPQAAAQPAAAPYLLAEDDVISVTVINFPNLSVPQIVIPPDGKIGLPLIDTPFSVTGKTISDLSQFLTQQYRRSIKGFSVSVGIVQKRKDSVLVYGYVLKPGVADYKAPFHALQALAQVGGSLPNGDLSKAVVTRKDGTKQAIDLSHPERKGGTPDDVLLAPGDSIYIPEQRNQISVVGMVTKAGSFDYKEDMTVLDALTVSGPVLIDTADLKQAVLTHNGVEQPLDLDAMLRHGDLTGNVKLVAGDRILVPENRKRVYVCGAVNRPGYYLHKDKDRVLDAITSCGGMIQDQADLAHVKLLHVASDKSTAKLEELDFNKVLKKGDVKLNREIMPGEVIYVPFRQQGFKLSNLWDVLAPLNIISTTTKVL